MVSVVQATVSGGFFKALLDFTVSLGADRAALMAATGLVESDFADPDARIALPAYKALYRAGAALTGDPAPPLKFPEAFGMFNGHADALLKSLEDSKTTRGRVEALLIPQLHTGELGMDEVAKAMGLSRQTLYRRLKAEGVSFDQVLDALRRRMAEAYLDKLSVNETAYLLGFSETSAFSRAYKRWTGTRPRGRQSSG